MKKILWLCFMFTMALSTVGYGEKKHVYILCYHTFLGKPQIQTDFSISEFQQHITLLRQKKYTFVQWRDILKNNITGTKNILIMIDDGNVSTYKAYQAALKPFQIKPVLAIYPGIINSRKFALTWAQLQEMRGDGCEIASHGYFHMYLTTKFAQNM
jgi:peptidoglycan/xylan/chitin deacetylase (PgdA/CDA1 family)